jgi:hypothetical protein
MEKAVSAPTQGTKATLSTKVFVETWIRISSVPQNESITEWHRCCPCGDGSSYRDWLESPRVQIMAWWRAPSDELLSQYNPARLKVSTSNSREQNASEDGPLTVDEFSRLACILTQHKESRRALLDSQLDLSRAQLGRSERRDDFRALKIAPLFNNPATLVSFKPPIDLPEILALAPPLAPRGGSRLLLSCSRTRSIFTVSHANWYSSGQNDPKIFISFLPAMVGGGDQIPVESRRALILFHILGCGTDHEHMEVLDCERRTSKAQYDDLEEASNGVSIGSLAKIFGTTSGSGIKRNNRDDDIIGQAFLEGANRLADAISAPQSSPSTSSGK